MKFIAITVDGLEEISSNEIEEVLDAKITEKTKGKIIFESEEEFLISALRSIDKALILIDKFQFKDMGEIVNQFSKIDLKNHLKNTFMVRCHRTGEHNFTSQDIEKEIGEIIFTNNIQKVDLKNPDTIVYIDIENNDCIVGIDLTKTKLSRRDYRIKVHAGSINSLIAYCLVRLSDFKENELLLDPFCNDGVICIEAALYKKGRVIGFDEKSGCIKSCIVNSKIANMDIKFENEFIDNLDKKFQKEEIDKIVTKIPYYSKSKNKYENISNKLFEKSNNILKNEGAIIILSQKPEILKESAKKNNFKLEKETILPSKDNQSSYILVFKKNI